MKSTRLRLGETLEQRGVLQHEVLLRALRNQKVLGGRLGTCLLEIEAVSEEDLLAALADVQGAATATPEDLRGIPDEVTDLVPKKVARRCLAIPFHASSTQVKVAVTDARDLDVQNEVSFVVGRRIVWHVAPELRIYEALEKYYHEECPTRYAKLLDRLNRSRFLWSREPAGRGSTGSGIEVLRWSGGGAETDETRRESERQAPAPGRDNSLPSFALEDHAALAPLPDPVAPPTAPRPARPEVVAAAAAPEPAAAGAEDSSDDATFDSADTATGLVAPLSVEEAERRLLNPADRDDVARVVVDFAASRARRAALLVVRNQEITVWRWAGEGLDGPVLAAYRSSFTEPSIFVGLRDGAAQFRGVLPPMPAHLKLLAAFDPPAEAAEFFALPIRVRSRLVAVLLSESNPGPVPTAAIDEMKRVVAKCAIAFELCIMRAKLRKA
ncbi:MAG: hypothetical protein R2862_04755 [Thermoanaerobaculia bacterium]